MKDKKILVIDDEKNILESIKMVLSYENYRVETSSSGLDGLELFKSFHPDIILLDNMKGAALGRAVRIIKAWNKKEKIVKKDEAIFYRKLLNSRLKSAISEKIKKQFKEKII